MPGTAFARALCPQAVVAVVGGIYFASWLVVSTATVTVYILFRRALGRRGDPAAGADDQLQPPLRPWRPEPAPAAV